MDWIKSFFATDHTTLSLQKELEQSRNQVSALITELVNKQRDLSNILTSNEHARKDYKTTLIALKNAKMTAAQQAMQYYTDDIKFLQSKLDLGNRLIDSYGPLLGMTSANKQDILDAIDELTNTVTKYRTRTNKRTKNRFETY